MRRLRLGWFRPDKGLLLDVEHFKSEAVRLSTMLQAAMLVLHNRRSGTPGAGLDGKLNSLIDELELTEQKFDRAATIMWDIVGRGFIDDNGLNELKAFLNNVAAPRMGRFCGPV